MSTTRNCVWWDSASVSRNLYTNVRRDMIKPNIIVGGGLLAHALAYLFYMEDIPVTIISSSPVGVGNSSRHYGGLGYLPQYDLEKQIHSFGILDSIFLNIETTCLLSETGTIYKHNKFPALPDMHIHKKGGIVYSPQTFFVNPLLLLGDLSRFCKFAEIPVYDGRDIRFDKNMNLYIDGAKYSYENLIFCPDSYNEYKNAYSIRYGGKIPFRKSVCFVAEINSDNMHENYNVFYENGLHVTYYNDKLFGEILVPQNQTIPSETITSKEMQYCSQILEDNNYFLNKLLYLWPRVFVQSSEDKPRLLTHKNVIFGADYGYQEFNNLFLIEDIMQLIS